MDQGYSIPIGQRKIAYEICGLLNGAWKLPLLPPSPMLHVVENSDEDPTTDTNDEIYSKYEAAYRLILHHETITIFATRGASLELRQTFPFNAELADPYCEPNLEYVNGVDVCLRHVTSAFITWIRH